MNNTLNYTDDGKDIIYQKGNVEYLIPEQIYEHYLDHIGSYNVHLFFTITLDPKYVKFKNDLKTQKQLIDNTIDKNFKPYNYLYTYELQQNGNLHVHGFLLTDYLSDSKKTLLRRDVRADLTNHYDRKGINRTIQLEKPINLTKSILYTIKELKDPIYFPTKKVLKRNNMILNQNKLNFIKEIQKEEEVPDDDKEHILVSFN